jgi:hypothetical protein
MLNRTSQSWPDGVAIELSKPWYKVTFDPTQPGTAKVMRAGRKRMATAKGRWVVFDKNCGFDPCGFPKHPVFYGETFDECCKHIDTLEAQHANQ